MFTKSKLLLSCLGLLLLASGCATSDIQDVSYKTTAKHINARVLLRTYGNIASVSYAAALRDAKLLQKSIDIFVAHPTKINQQDAKAAWLNSRESYLQTEAFRLSNGPIDADGSIKNSIWAAKKYSLLVGGGIEGEINPWPLDENMIDYTIDAHYKRTHHNIIDTRGVFNPGGEDPKPVNVRKITAKALRALNANGGDANVAAGYHAIEFLLWGQDQDYHNFMADKITHGPLVAGLRSYTDYTTAKYANRRKAYLKVVTDLLVKDLAKVNTAWNGKAMYRKSLIGELKGKDASKNLPSKVALKQIFIGIGTFLKSELANERIAVAVLTPSEEDEHSCFSDNTNRDIYQNYMGAKNIIMGTYDGLDFGVSFINTLDAKTKAKMLKLMNSIELKFDSVNSIARVSRHFDWQIRPNDPQHIVLINLKNQLRHLGDMMVKIAKANGINLTTSDVTDPDETKV